MQSSGMLCRVVLVRTDVSEEGSAYVFLRSVRRLLVTANVVSRSPILVILAMEVLRSSETSVLTRTTRRNIPEDGIRINFCFVSCCHVTALCIWADSVTGHLLVSSARK
jgi:hypothetical protein